MNKRKLKLGINIALVVLCVACVGIFAWGYPRLTRLKAALDVIDTKTNSTDTEDEEAIEEEDTGYWNIVLFGLDSRKEESLTDMDTSNYGDKRSDCIIIISINRETGDIKLLSVYRDTYLQMRAKDYYDSGDYIYDKATHAYFYGSANLVPGDETIDAGPYFSIDMLERNLDIEIDNFVAVNFSIVADVIDALGGVEIELTQSECNDINQYIDEINSIKGTSSEHITEAGTYLLDGVQATAYGRVRHTTGDDYKRTERQRTVLFLAAAKAQEADIDTLIDLVELIAPEVRTDLTAKQMLSLVNSVKSYNLDDEEGSAGFPFNVTDDSSYVYADDLAENVKELHEYLYGDTEYEVPESVQEISDYITNKLGGNTSSYSSDYYNSSDDDSDDSDSSSSGSSYDYSDSSDSSDSYSGSYSSSESDYYDSGSDSSSSDYSDSTGTDYGTSDSSVSTDSSYTDSGSDSSYSSSDYTDSGSDSSSSSSDYTDSSYSDSSSGSDSDSSSSDYESSGEETGYE